MTNLDVCGINSTTIDISVAYIYQITNLINQKKYIGKTSSKDPQVRWKQHKQLARLTQNNTLNENNSAHSMPIIRAICKYGVDNFQFTVLEECADDVVNEREEHYIRYYNTAAGKGYNCTYGGEGIVKPVKYWSNHPNSQKVDQYTLDGEYLATYDSRGQAAYAVLNRRPAKSEKLCIRACIVGTTFQALGYRWAQHDKPLAEVEKRINRRGPVYGINPTLNEKRYFKSQADAAEYIEHNRKNNNSVQISLSSPNHAKRQVKGWYLFRDKNDALSDWKKATIVQSKEHYQQAAQLSKLKRARPVRGVNLITGEVIEFPSLSDASCHMTGSNRRGVANIQRNCVKETSKHAYGYKWSYIDAIDNQ